MVILLSALCCLSFLELFLHLLTDKHLLLGNFMISIFYDANSLKPPFGIILFNPITSVPKQLLEILFSELGLCHHKLGQLIQDLIELDIVLVLRQVLVVPHVVPQFSFAVQQLVQVPQKQLELADIATFLVAADALDEYFVDAFETGNEVSVHVLDFRVLAQESCQVGIWVEVVIVAHEVLPQKDAGVEPSSDLRVDLFGVGHQLLELLGQSDHAFSESGQQFLDEVQILVELPALDYHGLSLEVVEGNLEVDLFELFHKPLGLLLFVKLHLYTTSTIF